MLTLLQFVFMILQLLLTALVWVVIANAIVSWLVAFDVINVRNRFAYSVVKFLDAVTRPMLRPFQRFIPPLGGIDVTPVILIILIQATNAVLLPGLFRWLAGMLAPSEGV
jgi:YggT family protein